MTDRVAGRRLTRLFSRDRRQRGSATSSLPGRSPTVDEEVERLIRRYAARCGALGALTGMPGAAAAAVQASATSTLALHLRMIAEIARLYGHRSDTHDFETDALAIVAGDATKELVKRAGVEWSHQVAWRSLHRAAAMIAQRRIDHAPPGPVLVSVGVPRPLARLVPLAGAPVGFGIDYAFARAVGHRAVAHYRPRSADVDVSSEEAS